MPAVKVYITRWHTTPTRKMPKIDCPIAECDYKTPDVEAVVAAALITTHATIHNAPATNRVTSAKIKNVKRPVVSSAGTSEDWSYFSSRWSDYVAATKVSVKDRIIQLLECCDKQLRKDLTRSAGGTLTNDTEEDVLKAMKKFAVREENTMVARFTLHRMHQEEDEPIRSYGARLQGQAGVCKFIISYPHCSADMNYTEPVLCDVLSKGLHDSGIQVDLSCLLGDRNQNMSLVLPQIHGAEAASSSYKRGVNNSLKQWHKTHTQIY